MVVFCASVWWRSDQRLVVGLQSLTSDLTLQWVLPDPMRCNQELKILAHYKLGWACGESNRSNPVCLKSSHRLCLMSFSRPFAGRFLIHQATVGSLTFAGTGDRS